MITDERDVADSARYEADEIRQIMESIAGSDEPPTAAVAARVLGAYAQLKDIRETLEEVLR